MSSDDRTNPPPAAADDPRPPDRAPLREDRARAQPARPAAPSDTPTARSRWQVDPEEVDRYLAERARAASAYPPPSSEPTAPPSPSYRQPPAPEHAPPPPAARSSSAGTAGRGRRPASTTRRQEPAPAHDPFAADEWSDILDDSWQEPAVAGSPVAGPAVTAPGQRRPRQSARARTQARGVVTTRTTRPRPRPLPKLVLPAAIRRADFVHDRTALLFFGLSIVSAAAMAMVVATRLGGLNAFVPVHLDAGGQPDRWGARRSLWALPLLAAMIPLVNAALGSIGSGIDHFARRFLLATSLLVQLLAWVAVIRLL